MHLLAENYLNILLSPPVVYALMGIPVALVALIVPPLLKSHRTTTEARLKERMVERGFSADEIERVIRAGSVTPPDSD